MGSQSISVSLPVGTLYVSGTVNGDAVTWTNTEGNRWEAIAARAADNIYHVELTIIGSTGNSTKISMTLYSGLLNLITDRTQADVDRVATLTERVSAGTATAAELAAWQSDLKGAYNASDLNRVGAAVAYVAGWLNVYGYAVTVTAKQDWTGSDIPTAGQMATYLRDVAALRGAIAVMASTPPTPDSANNLTWKEANNIEQILLDVDKLLTRMAAAWFYSGELYAGEV